MLEGDGRTIAQRRMKTGAVVVADVARHRLVQSEVGRKDPTVNGVGLERVEERLGEGIVGDLAGSLHALCDPEGG